MAESYQGLTIRIGGDTTGLMSDLKAANGAISTTQRELRKLDQASKLDPDNLKVYTTQMGYMAQKASEVAMRLQQLKAAADQTASRQVSMGVGKDAGKMSVAALAATTEDAALAAEMANARYNKLTDSLARMNTKVSELAMEAGKVELDEIAAEFANIPVGKGVDALIERFKALPETIRPGEKALETFKKKVQDLGEAFKGEKDKDKRAGFITEYKELVDKMVTANVPVFNFENGNIGADDIRTALEDIADIIGLDQTAIDEFIDRVKELKNAFKDAKSEVERTRIVKQFEDLKVEITKTEAVIASVNRAMAKLTVPSETSKRIHELNENVKFLESTFKSLQKSSSTLGDIVKADPGNVQAVTVAMHVLAESERNVEEEAKRIQEQIDSYDQASISAYTDSTKTAAQQLYDSAIAAEEAGNAYSDLNGKMSAWKHELDMLESSVEEETLDLKGMAEGDEEAAAAKDRLAKAAEKNAERMDELSKAIAENSPELQRLKAESQEASRALEMSKARNELETLSPRLVEVKGRLADIKAAAESMAKTLTEAVKAEGIKDMFGDTSAVVKGFMSDFESSVGRADVFGKALSILPANAELADAKMESLTEAIMSGQRALAALEAASEQIDVSVVNQMKEAYGTVENAIRQTTAATQDLTKRQLEARENLAMVVSSSDYAGDDSDRVESLLLTKQEIEALPEEIRDAYDELSRLTAELDEAWAATAKAAQAGQWQEYQSGIVKTRTEIKGLRDDLKESASKKVDLEIDSEVSETFSKLIKQVDQYDAAIKKAVDEAKDLYAAFKATDDHELEDQSLRAFAEAESLAADKARLIQEYIDGFDSSRIDALREKYGSLTLAASKTREEFSNTEKKIAQLRQRIQEFANTAKDKSWVNSISDGNVEISKFPPEVQKAVEELRNLESVEFDQKLSAQIAAVSARLEELGFDADTAAAKVKATFDQTTKESGGTAKKTVDEAAFQQAFTRVSQYAQQAGRAVVESANTIDAAYRDMRKTVDGTEQQFESLRDAAIAFSQTHAVSADTILEIESYGGQLGVAVDHLNEFGSAVSNLAIATDITADDMALQLGQMTNIMSDLDYTSFEGFADVLVRLGNNTAATESMIMNVAQRMAAVANVTSMTTPQLMAWSAAIASTGQRSESAATAINKTIIGIGDAVTKGGDTLQQFANIAHMSVDEFKNAWENSSSDALEAFVKGLSELSDSNTDALQALDDVGISSIRQTTALLALSQTVGNVDSAMRMAEDAFVNGGDAAKEAAEKSKGFSGSLAILQNNASNLAASLGDGMVPYMNLLSSTLSVVTNVLNSMPGPLKSIVVGVTGVTLAVGALSVTLRALKLDAVAKQVTDFVSGINGSKVSLKGLADAASLIVEKFKDAKAIGFTTSEAFTFATTAGNGATASFTALAGAATMLKTALAGIGIGLAVTAVMALIGAIGKNIDEYNKLREAQDALSKSTSRLRDAARGATPEEKNLKDSIKDVGTTASETTQYINKLAEAQDQLANKIEGDNLELKVKTDMVNEAIAKVEELSKKGTELSAVDQADLITSVKLLNDQLGMTLEVVDPVKGLIRDMGNDADVSAAQIADMANKALGLSEQETLVEEYTEARKALAEAENEVAEKTAAVEKMQQAGMDKLSSMVPSTRAVVDANLSLVSSNQAAAGSYGQLKTQLDAAKSNYNSTAATVKELADRLRESSSSQIRDLDETREAVYRLADGSKDLKSAMSDLGKTDMDLNTFVDQFVYLGGTEEDFAKLTAAQLAEVVRAYNGTSASIATALASMNVSLSNAMMAAANATPQIVKPDDSAVREYKNQQEAAYTAAKRETEDYYNAEKKARDRYYDEQKRALDKAYNQRKKELDAEYDAAKKASDSYLKDYKKAQDEAVDAFKAATDARLKELEREYDAKKDMLELDYQGYDDQISDRIQAIKDEQAAEDKALKMRERAEKLAELGKAVESAKTNKAREEAEKSLQEYKEQLAREDLKEQRNARIAALEESRKDLKEQLSQRQEHLKETYDAAVEGYKAEREAKLKILQGTNEAEYESQKALEEAKLNNIKASHEAELEMQKEANELYLQGIKDQHEAELLSIKRANEDKLTELKNQQEAELAAYKEGGEAAVAALNGVKEEAVELGETVKNTSEEMQQVVTVSLGEIVRQLNEKGVVSMQTYLGAMSQIPGGMSRIFEEAGIATGDGVKEVARLMYEQGEIGLSQYMAIMNNMPGATSAIANETGVALAARLGVFGEDVRIASQNLVDNAKYPMETLEPIAKANADKYAAQLAAVGSAENAEKVAKGSGNLFEAMRGPLANSDKAGEADGAKYPAGMLKGLNDTGQKAVDATVQLGDAVVKASDVKNAMSATGENDLIGWWNGFAANMPSILANVVSFFNNVVGVSQKAQGVHSPSTKFAWMAEMDLAGYSRGWERSEDGVLRMVRRTSEGLTAAFDPGSGGFAQDMLDTMREREGDFRSQAERLARIVEDGFDPRLSLESAYQAMDRIDAATLRRQQTIAASSNTTNDNRSFNITISIPEVVVREEADIDRLSQQIALRVQRSINARIG